MDELWLAVRSVGWALLLPGVVAGLVPWQLFGLRDVQVDDWTAVPVLGVTLLSVGVTTLLICVWEFAHVGRGTLSPVDPPRALVMRGPYRYVRNPMYLGVALALAGEALLVWRPGIVVYALGWFAAVNAFVAWYEEPRLRRQFGEAYERYARRVRRWVPRRPRRRW